MKPVLISGAGLGGLLLARSLRRNSIPFEVFERDANVAARGQGYRIRISTDGLNALKSVLTEVEYDSFKVGTSETAVGGIHALDGVTGEPDPTASLTVSSKSGSNAGPKLGGDVLGVARGFLRSELIKGLEDQVHWNKRTKGYETLADGVRLLFADGSSSVVGSMLIAADGPQSPIAKQLTNGKVRAFDTGARMIHGQSPARAFAELGDGVWSVRDSKSVPGSTLALITNIRPGSLDQPDLELGWVFAGSPGSFEPPDGNFSIHGKVAADIARHLTKQWHPKFRAIFEQQNDAEAAFLKMSTAAPDGIPEWNNDPRVTLLGDAVHCMTPAGGVGANTALKDAAILGSLISASQGWDDQITSKYEGDMRLYAGVNVKMSFEEASRRFDIKELK